MDKEMIMKYSDPMTSGPPTCLKETKQICSAELLTNIKEGSECMLLNRKYKPKNTAFTQTHFSLHIFATPKQCYFPSLLKFKPLLNLRYTTIMQRYCCCPVTYPKYSASHPKMPEDFAIYRNSSLSQQL